MGRWESRSRWWTVGTAASAEGKSPALTRFVQDLVEACRNRAANAPGHRNENYHVEGGGRCTTAAAIDKLRSSGGYLLLQSDEAGALIDTSVVAGGRCDKGEVIDLSRFLSAAHGGSFSSMTMHDRAKRLKVAPPAPAEPACAEDPLLTMPTTNVTMIWLQQE
eukprot:9337881-Prorocentrum_lima.AAC.1